VAPKNYTQTKFDDTRRDEGWIRSAAFTSVSQLEDYLESRRLAWLQGPQSRAQLRTIIPSAQAHANTFKVVEGVEIVGLDRLGRTGFISLHNPGARTVVVWSFDVDATDPQLNLERMAVIARADTGARLRLIEQEDKSHMWRAPFVHPMQVRENSFQRVVRAAGRDPGDGDSNTAESEALARYFMLDASEPETLAWTPREQVDTPYASVSMNHLIETFYLFRLLVRYRVESAEAISDDLRGQLSGELTSLLHNGGEHTRWVSNWLTKKIADLGARIEKLNGTGERRVIFFLKGGRALNYYLGTPEEGVNDWDTQVVINPELPATEWYELLSRVHDVVLEALRDYNVEFTTLARDHAKAFGEYLEGLEEPLNVEAHELDEHEFDALDALEHANCKAELIDVGLPRRDTASAIEEWRHLSHEGALLRYEGVIFPHRPYYVNEYVMMIRDAFLPKADTRKAAKRVVRLGLLLDRGVEDRRSAEQRGQLQALPKTMAAIEELDQASRKELLRTLAEQFAVAYGLRLDRELAGPIDDWAASLIGDPPPLSEELVANLNKKGLSANQQQVCADIGIAHALSERVLRHIALRGAFVRDRQQLFDRLLLELLNAARPILATHGAQIAVVGSYAAHLHAQHLRMDASRLDPIRRVVVQLQCPAGQSEVELIAAVHDVVAKVVADISELELVSLGEDQDPKRRSLALRWTNLVSFDEGLRYQPLMVKIRAAVQTGQSLPVLASIRGIPTLDLRHLATDYLHKSAKVDESGARRVLASATASILEMMSQFEFSARVTGS
jgi:hypothetical protein